jgi:hypothetical protein
VRRYSKRFTLGVSKSLTASERHQVRGLCIVPDVVYRGQSTQGKNLLPYPEPRAAQTNFFDQIANEGLSGALGIEPFKQPQREEGTGHGYPSCRGIPLHRSVSAFFAALTSRLPAVVMAK